MKLKFLIKLLYPEFWQSRGLLAYLLLPLSFIYWTLGVIRRLITAPIKLPGKVICAGNITVGGTGKTQLVVFLAQLMTQKKVKFVIITKGYGGNLTKAKIVKPEDEALEVGDESLILAKYGTVIAAKKIKFAADLINDLAPESKPEIIIVDDGLQNPAFIKDVKLLVVDGERAFGNGFLLPAGPLRQTLASIEGNVNAVIMVGTSKTSKNSILQQKLDKNFALSSAVLKIFHATINPIGTYDITKKYIAFSGIGNPERFFKVLKEANFNIVQTEIFQDHHSYCELDLDNLVKKAISLNASLVTTRKDYVKIPTKYQEMILCLDVKLVINEENELVNLIDEALFPRKNQK